MRLEARDWVSCCDTHLQGCCRGASVGGTRRKKERRTRLREGVWSAVPTERGGCGFAMFSDGCPAVFDVTGNGAPPHSLWTPNRRDNPSGSPLSKFGPFCNGCNGYGPPFPDKHSLIRISTPPQTPLDTHPPRRGGLRSPHPGWLVGPPCSFRSRTAATHSGGRRSSTEEQGRGSGWRRWRRR
jgi:hypothetical protein